MYKLFSPETAALGHGNLKSAYIPNVVEALRKYPPFISVSAGDWYTHALNEKGDLYTWGRGEYAVFGDGDIHSRGLPIINQSIKRLRKNYGKIVIKMKAVGNTTAVLMSKSLTTFANIFQDDGTLYFWGVNKYGQMGLRNGTGEM